MVIGDLPGTMEDKLGLPFVGKFGGLFDAYLDELGYPSEQVWITHVVKHKSPSNRKPRSNEISACAGFLLSEIKIACPRVILCLGATAFEAVTGHKFDKGKGRIQAGKPPIPTNIPVIGTWHPSACIRMPGRKVEVLRHLRFVKETLEATRL